MLFLLSPAKSLDYDTPVPNEIPSTRPYFEAPRGPSVELIKLLREKSPQQISELMHLSDKLSALNVARYHAWAGKGTPKNARSDRCTSSLASPLARIWSTMVPGTRRITMNTSVTTPR